MMFADWVTDGAAFGIKAFFALGVFALICAAVVGLVSLGVRFYGWWDDAKDRQHH